ncbi:DUF1366 domain-containing protein [Gemella bergeri]
MSKFKFSWQIPTYFESKIVSTKIQIVSDDSSNVINVTVPKDCSNYSYIELVNLALEQFYQETYPNRAENEKFAKIDEKLKLVDEKMAQIEQIKKESEVTQASLMELISKLSEDLTKEVQNDDPQDKKQVEGGDQNDGNVIRD